MTVHLDLFAQAGSVAVWPIFVDAAVKGSIVLSAAWLATRAMRHASAAMRHLTWALGVYGVLALPILTALLPGWRILPAWAARESAAATPPAPPAIQRATTAVHGGPQDVPRYERSAEGFGMSARSVPPLLDAGVVPPDNSLDAAARAPARVHSAAPPGLPWWRRAGWRAWALAAWGCGAAVMMLPIMVSLLGLRRLGQRTARIEGGTWGRLLRECAERLGLRRRITLLRGRCQVMPMTWGIVSPKLLLPPEADRWPQERRRVVLMHELAHVKRGDFLTQLVVHLARAVYWFNPLIWIASKQIALESEGACDDLVLNQETRASDYAEHLLTVAAGLEQGALLPIAAIAMAKSSRLEARLLDILDGKRNRATLTVARTALLGLLVAAVIIPVAALRAGGSPADKPPVAGVPDFNGPSSRRLNAQAASPPTVSTARDGNVVIEANHAGQRNAADAPPANATASGELAGTVTDAAGKPLAGVLVDVWTWCPGDETTTDQRGRFILKKLGSEPVEIRFSKVGFGPWYNPIQPTGVADLQVKLSNRTYFEGDVKAPDGKPVDNALVRADSGPKHNPGVEITSVWTETRSDKTGHYRLYVMPDNYVIQVRVPKVGTARIPQTAIADGQSKKLDINLKPGVTFHAIVVDSQNGLPVPNVRLWHWEHKGVEGTSGKDGSISIDGMPPGHFTFNVQASGYTRWWSQQAVQPHQKKEVRDSLQRNFDDLEFDAADDMAPVKIELEREVRITGLVQDPDGNPVAGATVAPADGTGNSLTGDTRFSVLTAKDGTFVITLPASGTARYNLEAHDGGHEQWRKWANGILPPIQTRPGDELKDVVIKLTRPAVVRGHVKDESGKPLVDREVRASAADKLENRYYDPTTTTDKNGDFELRFIRPGDQFIQAAPFFWTNVPPGGMTLKLKNGETNSMPVTLKEGERRAGVELTAPASTKFPSFEEQLRQAIEKSEHPATQPRS